MCFYSYVHRMSDEPMFTYYVRRQDRILTLTLTLKEVQNFELDAKSK